MCYTAVICKLENKEISDEFYQKTKKVILENILVKQYGNHEGSGAIAKNYGSKSFYKVRDMNYKRFLKRAKGQDLFNKDIFGIHFRNATEGTVNLRNIHFWQGKGFYFAHNGIVYQQDKDDKGRSDSLLFFNKILNKISNVKNYEGIASMLGELIDKTGFSGRGFLLDNKKLILFGDLYSYLVNDCFVVFSSAELDFKEYQGKSFGDLYLYRQTTKVDIISGEIEGVSLWDFKDKVKKTIHKHSYKSYSNYKGLNSGQFWEDELALEEYNDSELKKLGFMVD